MQQLQGFQSGRLTLAQLFIQQDAMIRQVSHSSMDCRSIFWKKGIWSRKNTMSIGETSTNNVENDICICAVLVLAGDVCYNYSVFDLVSTDFFCFLTLRLELITCYDVWKRYIQWNDQPSNRPKVVIIDRCMVTVERWIAYILQNLVWDPLGWSEWADGRNRELQVVRVGLTEPKSFSFVMYVVTCTQPNMLV